MYFWNYKQLASDFINNTISERQKLSYILIPTILGFIGTILKVILSFTKKFQFNSNLALDIFPNSVMLSIIAFETFFILTFMIITYKINSKIDDKDFLGRYFAFRFISVIRAIVFLFLLSLVFSVVNDFHDRWIFINMYELLTIFAASMIYSCYIQVKSFFHLKSIYLLSQKSRRRNNVLRKEEKNKSIKPVKLKNNKK